MKYWSKLWVVDICTSWSRRLLHTRIVGGQIYSKVNYKWNCWKSRGARAPWLHSRRRHCWQQSCWSACERIKYVFWQCLTQWSCLFVLYYIGLSDLPFMSKICLSMSVCLSVFLSACLYAVLLANSVFNLGDQLRWAICFSGRPSLCFILFCWYSFSCCYTVG